MDKKLGIGIIGVGGIAQSHIQAITRIERARLVAVMDVDSSKVEAVSNSYNVKGYTNLEELLDDPEIDAVHVCTPHKYHGEQVVLSARAGKHVLVEKPMALTLEECDAMIEESEKAGKILMVGQVMRYFPANRTAKKLIADGAIGKVGHLIRRRLSYFNPSAGGPYRHWYMDLDIGGICVLYCFGPHEYDILHWYIDSPIKEVYARGSESTEIYSGQKDSYTAIMSHENGAISVLSQSVVCHFSAHDQYFIGSEGSMFLHGDRLMMNGKDVPVEGSSADGMFNQISEFVDCCLEGRQPDANGRSVRHTMAVIEAAKQSAERKRAVYVDEFELKK